MREARPCLCWVLSIYCSAAESACSFRSNIWMVPGLMSAQLCELQLCRHAVSRACSWCAVLSHRMKREAWCARLPVTVEHQLNTWIRLQRPLRCGSPHVWWVCTRVAGVLYNVLGCVDAPLPLPFLHALAGCR